MSGFCAIYAKRGGGPASNELLQRLTLSMQPSCPDGCLTWADGALGFAYCMLRVLEDVPPENQPARDASGSRCLLFDGRIDNRTELFGQLAQAGSHASASDSQLVLQAYLRWGRDCPDHLLGDFAFALWDRDRQEVFCARDHFGVKPFFYGDLGDYLVFSNTLDCLRLVPGFSGELDEQAVADFLLFGLKQDLSSTIFRQIRRLPPGHWLSCGADGGLVVRKYWSLPVIEEPDYRPASQIIEEFRDKFDTAVRDRLRAKRVGVTLSGGLDSTSITVVAHKELSHRYGADFSLRGYTWVYHRLIADEEWKYADRLGAQLGIAVEHIVSDEHGLYERYDTPELRRSQPIDLPLLVTFVEMAAAIAGNSRVALQGEGGDPLLYSTHHYFPRLLRRGRLDRFALDLSAYVLQHRRLPLLGLRSAIKRRLGLPAAAPLPSRPDWLNPEFAGRCHVAERFDHFIRPFTPNHSVRPEAYSLLTSPLWVELFENSDRGATNLPVEFRYPFFDLRLVTCALVLPPAPWCIDKEILRRSMGQELPAEIRRRPKTAMAGDPAYERFRGPDRARVQARAFRREMDRFVDCERIRAMMKNGEVDETNYFQVLRAYTINEWLQTQNSIK